MYYDIQEFTTPDIIIEPPTRKKNAKTLLQKTEKRFAFTTTKASIKKINPPGRPTLLGNDTAAVHKKLNPTTTLNKQEKINLQRVSLLINIPHHPFFSSKIFKLQDKFFNKKLFYSKSNSSKKQSICQARL
mgnify:FL=1